MNRHWRKLKLERFSDRETLSYEELFEGYFSILDLPKKEVKEFLNLIEDLYEVPIGKLRPYDSLSMLFSPVRARNFLERLSYEIYDSDLEFELNEHIEKKIKKQGQTKQWSKLVTIKDCVSAWCGKPPN